MAVNKALIVPVVNRTVSAAALRWGKDNEPKAVKEYESRLGATVTPSGLTLHPHLPYLGATADGVVHDAVIEVKCPYSGRFKSIHDLINSGYTHLYNIGSKVALHETSPYYCQVQGERAIKQYSLCHFVIWTLVDFTVIDVLFDPDFWHHKLLPKFTPVST